MGTILAGTIFGSARITLLDPLPDPNWSDDDLLAWLNEAERAACGLRPELFTEREAIALEPGTLQVLPERGTAVMRLDENAGSKTRCRLVDAAMLDATARAWPAELQQRDVSEWAQDPRDRKRFHVWPPNDGTGSVVSLFGASPPPIPSPGSPINLDDVYEQPLKNFVISMAYSANTKRQDLTKATYHMGQFEKALGINAQSTVAVLPKLGNTGGA